MENMNLTRISWEEGFQTKNPSVRWVRIFFWTNSIIIHKENTNNVQGALEILGRGAVEVIFQLSSVGDDPVGVKIKPQKHP